jgi:hypothetical protein
MNIIINQFFLEHEREDSVLVAFFQQNRMRGPISTSLAIGPCLQSSPFPGVKQS